MKLNIQERFVITAALPKEGNFMELLFSRQVSDSIKITSEETDEYEIKYTTTDQGISIAWSPDAMTKEIECYLATEHIKLLKGIFEKLDEEKKITMENFTTAKKIFEAAKELNI